MASEVHRGYLIIADISGYTAFLTGIALEHGQAILTRLLQTIIDRCQPPVELVELEGDAVYVHLPADQASAQLLLDRIDGTYFAFAAQRELIQSRYTAACNCEACAGVPALDLKFVVHYGQFVLQHLAGQAKPIGPDVILVHRLLKNRIADVFGWHAYLFMTQAASEQLALDTASLGFQPHAEDYEHLGTVEGATLDLQPLWAAERIARRQRGSTLPTWCSHSVELPAPPAVVWDYLTAPEPRARWAPPGAWDLGAPGEETDATSARLLDWQPAEYFRTRSAAPLPLRPTVQTTTRLEPTEEGTRVLWEVALEEGWRGRLVGWLGRQPLERALQTAGQRLHDLLSGEWQPTAAQSTLDVRAAVAHALAHPDPAA